MGKGLLVEGDREKRGLLGATVMVNPGELGLCAISYAEDEDEEDEDE